MKRRKGLSLTMRLVLTFGLVMLAANIVLGFVSLNQTKASMRTLIDKNMLDITNSAADLIDGDALGALTEEDVGGEVYQKIAQSLSVFQDNADIRFIYTVRQMGPDSFGFVVDPDPVEPADFGEEIVLTDGLLKAGAGTAAVDDEPMADRWGNFYSAYSPVFDSQGGVAGVVGIDFDAEWYERQVRSHTLYIGAISLLSLLIGGAAVFLITHSVRRRFQELDRGLSGLSRGVDELMDEITSISGYAPRQGPSHREEGGADELEVIGEKVSRIQKDLTTYLDYMHRQAYVDALTRVGNATAYHEAVDALAPRIASGKADFTVGVFDINNLKEINDTEGHQQGDAIIRGAADCIARVFSAERTYRIGGDEFAVVEENLTEAQMAGRMAAVEEAVEAFNASRAPGEAALAVSIGSTRYRPGEDGDYREVFARADRLMYAVKKEYYESIGNRRGVRMNAN